MTVSIVVKSERRFGAYEMITFTGSLVLGRRAESMFRLHRIATKRTRRCSFSKKQR